MTAGRMSHEHLQSFFFHQVAVFFHSFASLILSFWKDLHALIMLQANLNCSESSVLLVRVPCELLRSTCFLGENTFFFYLHSLDFNACVSAEEAHARMSTNRLVPDEHCVLWDLPCSLKIQQQGKEKKQNNKCGPHPYSFLASNFLSQTPNLPSRCVDMGFHSALILNSTSEGLRVLTVQNGEYITIWVQGEPGIVPVTCCTHFSLGKTPHSQYPFVRICDPVT